MSDNDDGAIPQAYFEGLLSHRKTLLELRADQLRTFDKAMLSLSGGALGLSIVFLDKITGPERPITLYIVLAWFSFAGAIASNVISYLTGSQDLMREVAKIDTCIRQAREYKSERNLFRWLTNGLNVVALVLFIGGVILLASHAYSSLPAGRN